MSPRPAVRFCGRADRGELSMREGEGDKGRQVPGREGGVKIELNALVACELDGSRPF